MDVCGDFFGGVDVVELGKMVAELRERLEEGVPSKTVFCHNDLQVGLLYYFFTRGTRVYIRSR